MKLDSWKCSAEAVDCASTKSQYQGFEHMSHVENCRSFQIICNVCSAKLQYKSHIGSVGVEQTKNVPEKLELASHFIGYE